MTGRYPHRTGAIDTLEMRGLDRLVLRETTIADLLRRSGYAGFSGGWHPYYNWRLDRNGVEARSDGRYLTDVFTDEAVAFVERHAREPFFLLLAYSAPHFPFEAPEEDVRPFAETGRFTRAVATLYGMVHALDRGVARARETLARLGLAENTLLGFTSDNGPQFGGKGEDCTDRFNLDYRGAKGLVYEGGILLPMLLHWPAGFDGRRELDALVHLTDWLPTLRRAAGAEAPRELALDGLDQLPLLRGDRGREPTTRFWQWNRYTPVRECNAAMRDGEWKLVCPAIRECMQLAPADWTMDVGAKLRPERYADIEHGPEPERLARMERALAVWFEGVEAERLRGLSSAPPSRFE